MSKSGDGSLQRDGPCWLNLRGWRTHPLQIFCQQSRSRTSCLHRSNMHLLPPSTLLVAPSRALSITAHHCCSLTSLSPTPQRHDSRSEYLHHHQCSSRNNYQMSEHLPHQTSLFDQSQDCCFTLLPSSAVFSSSPIHLHLEIQRKKL